MTTDSKIAQPARTAIPDQFLDASHLAAARAVLDREIGRENVRLAYVGGSLAAGLGHQLSDVDLHVVFERDVPAHDFGYRQDGHIVQVNPISLEQLAALARTCERYVATPGDRWQNRLPDADISNAVRYAIGTVLDDRGSGMPDRETARLTLRRIQMTRKANTTAMLAEDVIGALRASDIHTALWAAQRALESATECALAGAGDLYVGEKFLLRRTARQPSLAPVFPDIWSGLTLPPITIGIAETTEVVTRRLHFAGHLVAHALLSGWDEPCAPFPEFRGCTSGGGPVRSPWVIPIRYSESWGMVGPDTGFRVTSAMVRVWRELDGRPADEIHRMLSADPVTRGISRERLGAAIGQLAENGVVA